MNDRTAGAIPEALAVLQASTETLTAELVRRGFKVHSSRRIRRFDMLSVAPVKRLEEMTEDVRRRYINTIREQMACGLGRDLQHKGMLLNTEDDRPSTSTYTPDAMDRRFVTSIAIILPKSFDFEAEAKEERDAQMARLKAEAQSRR